MGISTLPRARHLGTMQRAKIPFLSFSLKGDWRLLLEVWFLISLYLWAEYLAPCWDTDESWHVLNYWESLRTNTEACEIIKTWEATRTSGQADWKDSSTTGDQFIKTGRQGEIYLMRRNQEREAREMKTQGNMF